MLFLQNIDLLIEGQWKNEIDMSAEVAAASDQVDSLVFERELEEIQKRKKKWQLAFANDVISLEDLRIRMQEENEREESIKAQLITHPFQVRISFR